MPPLLDSTCRHAYIARKTTGNLPTTLTRFLTILTVPEKLKAAKLWENLSPAELIEHAVRRGEGVLGRDGQLIVDTRPHTGRSPKDKFFVKEPSSDEHIDWGD